MCVGLPLRGGLTHFTHIPNAQRKNTHMFIVMHCGGMPFNGETIKEKSLGGSESAAYYMALELTNAGHKVTIFTNHHDEGVFDGVKYIFAGHPTKEYPLGDRFHFYAANTPHDVCMIQRHPAAFIHKYASKINLLWLHDLALHRTKGTIGRSMWNVDGVLCVSEWHKKQLCDIYEFNPEIVYPITNGVDLSLFDRTPKAAFLEKKDGQISLLYSSRPERGLEHLVRPGGIMERLAAQGTNHHLYVCNYDNTTQEMADYYAALYQRIEDLPNCTLLGSLTKQELADVMCQCDVQFYPTEFEEVSCITAMEAMAAGLPMITSDVGALRETTKANVDSGTILIPLKDGVADEEGFISALKRLKLDNVLSNKQYEAAQYYSWKEAGKRLNKVIDGVFQKTSSNQETVLKHLIHESDIYAAKYYAEKRGIASGKAIDELKECYSFAFENTFKEHYQAYYQYEKDRGVNYGPEKLDGNTRYESVAGMLSGLPKGAVVIDYGCAHGHYTINLAKRYPDFSFIGVDITRSNIDTARKWAAEENASNVNFVHGEIKDGEVIVYDGSIAAGASVVIAAEVLEHVADPWNYVDVLGKYLEDDGKMIITTPFGPWEAQGYKEHWPWRAHIHHFEREDLHKCFGHHPNFNIVAAPNGVDKTGEILGSYITSFNKPISPSAIPDYESKLKALAPRQTLSVCIIAKDAELFIGRCLNSVKDIADEIIVGIDNTTTDDTLAICNKYGASVIQIESPLVTGFEEARNQTLSKASGDWILWIDTDEVLDNPQGILKYLRNNQFNGYAIKQHHFTIDPPGVLKTDLPTRIFRNNIGIKFFGVVHEHPEFELNEGVGLVTLIDESSIAHYGYQNEHIRRGRFSRNIELLVRDREKNPTRHLGKFLWIRDLAQMCNYELERNGGYISQEMIRRAKMGMELWEELLADKNTRLLADGMEFYSILSRVLGGGFDFGIKVDSSKLNGGIHIDRQPTIAGHFHKQEHVHTLTKALIDERLKTYESKYF